MTVFHNFMYNTTFLPSSLWLHQHEPIRKLHLPASGGKESKFFISSLVSFLVWLLLPTHCM